MRADLEEMIPFHPLADVLPLLSQKQYGELVESIKVQGLLEPITLYEDKILDGRNRYRACLDASVKPVTEDFKGKDPIAFVLGKNLHRRHLTVGQRAMVAAKYAKLPKGDVWKGVSGARNRASSLTRKEAAELLSISEYAVDQAKVVHANGTPEEIASVVDGKVRLNRVFKRVNGRKKAKAVEKFQKFQENNKRHHGSKIAIPKGFATISAAARAGIRVEQAGGSKSAGIKASGLTSQTYDGARDIVLLNDRDGLSNADRVLVKEAMHRLDVLHTIGSAAKLIKPIVRKVWGRKGQRFKTDKKRLEEFSSAVSFVWTSCTTAAEKEVPLLNSEQREEAITQLTEAIKALVRLRTRIKGGE
jgi:ParB-like nuclease family protein